MNFFKIAAITGLALLAACGPQIVSKKPMPLTAQQTQGIENVVRNQMIDPDSTRFRNITGYDATRSDGSNYRYVCGEVNSRNRMGGYTGFSAFKGRYEGNTFILDYVDTYDTKIAYYSCKN